MATHKTKGAQHGLSGGSGLPSNPNVTVNEGAVAVRAYELWLERGSPVGSPEIDWLRAEEELNTQPQGPPLDSRPSLELRG